MDRAIIEHDLKMAFDDGYAAGHENGFEAGRQIFQPKWISVEDSLPKGANGSDFCELVIVYTQDYYVTTGWNNGGNWYLIDWDNDYASKHSPEYVTHWLPLPPAPVNTITPKEAD